MLYLFMCRPAAALAFLALLVFLPFLAEAQLSEGHALQFDGVDDYVEVLERRALKPDSAVAMEAWAYKDAWASSSVEYIVANSNVGGYLLRLYDNWLQALVRVDCNDINGSFVAAFAVSVSRSSLASGWHHFVSTFDGRYLKLYVDGSPASTSDLGVVCTIKYSYSHPLRIGVDSSAPQQFFRGRIDEVRVYNRTLSDAEVSQHYGNGLGQYGEPETGLLAGWHFDEGTGTETADYSGNNRIGYLTNGPVWIERTTPAHTVFGIATNHITPDSATITWLTNEDSNSAVAYGITNSYGLTTQDAALNKSHTITVTSLTPATTYHFQVKSTDALGINATSQDFTFSTLYPAPTDNQFYVSPQGSKDGNGALDSPWDLQTALNHPPQIKPGATIWLRGGVYRVSLSDGGFTSSLTGTASQPIKVRGYPGEWAVIDGNLTGRESKGYAALSVNGAYTWYMDFEVTDSDPIRTISTPGSNPPERRGSDIGVSGSNIKFINLVLHDSGDGFGSGSSASNIEAYGLVVYNVGWSAPDRGHGHNFYVQNQNGEKIIKDSMSFNAFDINVQMYGSSAAFLNNFTWDGNVFFNGGILFGGGTPINNLTVHGNYYYGTNLGIGYSNPYNNGISITDNYVGNASISSQLSKNVTITGNTVVNPNGPLIALSFNAMPTNVISDYTINNNLYYKPYADVGESFYIPSAYVPNSCGYWWFNRSSRGYGYCGSSPASWQEDLGYDLNSTYIDAMPTEAKYFLKQNQYDPNRANLIIYNWPKSNTVSVDVSSILAPGDTYKLINVQDYFNDVIAGTYSGGNLSVPMIGHTVAKPIGYDQVLGNSTFPEFGVFVIKRMGSMPQRRLVIDMEGPSDRTVSGTIVFIDSAANAVVKTLLFAADSAGHFTFPIPAGLPLAADVKVVIPGYLTRIARSQDMASSQSLDITVPLLLAGDLNGDGAVNALDFSLMSRQWNGAGAADYNRDGAVNALDFAFLRKNWWAKGE